MEKFKYMRLFAYEYLVKHREEYEQKKVKSVLEWQG